MIGKPTTGIIQIHNLANDNGYRALRQNKTEKNEDRERMSQTCYTAEDYWRSITEAILCNSVWNFMKIQFRMKLTSSTNGN